MFFFNKLFIKPNTHNIENTLFLSSNSLVHEKNFVKKVMAELDNIVI